MRIDVDLHRSQSCVLFTLSYSVVSVSISEFVTLLVVPFLAALFPIMCLGSESMKGVASKKRIKLV